MQEVETVVYQQKVEDEPMLFSAGWDFAYENGGPITKSVMDSILKSEPYSHEANVIIDTRVHMLKPGWYPAIPGWHLDAVPRDTDKEVMINHPQTKYIKHYLFLLDNGTESMTDFVQVHPSVVDYGREEGENYWGACSRNIQEAVDSGQLKAQTMKNNTLYTMDSIMDFHTATPAKGHGWRFFFRASYNTLTRGPFNEIRKQVQVYTPTEHSGW